MTDREVEWAQRIAVLEVKVENLITEQKEIVSVQTSIDTKLSELLELKSKGLGAFWLASTLMGTGLLGLVVALVNWARG